MSAQKNSICSVRLLFDQYLLAITFARRSIYIENQYLEALGIVEALHGAVGRGVEVVLVMSAAPDISPNAYESPERTRTAFQCLVTAR